MLALIYKRHLKIGLLDALTRLRGAENSDIIRAEFNRISTNLKIIQKENEISHQNKKSWISPIKHFFHLLVDPTFIKPFSFLLVVFCLALEWGGFPAIAYYMVPLLK